jgi:hypothetical protein
MSPSLRRVWLALVTLGLGLVASQASATPIGPSCGTCQGSVYDLTYDPTPVATTATTETWRITYTIDTSGYAGTGVYINTVALKVSSSFVDANLITAPGGVSLWSEMRGGLAAAGCTGSGSGFDCVAFRAPIALAPSVPGGTYTWEFDVEIETGGLLTGAGEASVKARYVNGTGTRVGALVSENITLSVPEPAAALLLAAESAFLKIFAWRRRSPGAPPPA